MKKIRLTQNKFALVDDDDYSRLNKHRWCTFRNRHIWYAVRNVTSTNGKQVRLLMHREIMNPIKKLHVDHVDGNGLNNQKLNLRKCTNSQNLANSKKQINNTSGYRGVSWRKRQQTWEAYISINKRRVHLGLFDSPQEAAQAYDDHAIKYFKEFARLNFPPVKMTG